MGSKLNVGLSDSIFQVETSPIKGLSGGCYCCGSQIHISFEDMVALPHAKINGEYYYVFICDTCENDCDKLRDKEIKDVSYDILWFLQESLTDELMLFSKRNGNYSSKDREEILYDLYSNFTKIGKKE